MFNGENRCLIARLDDKISLYLTHGAANITLAFRRAESLQKWQKRILCLLIICGGLKEST